ncbi:unnamed protein product [Cylicocyclus nassatus]|uniref:Ethylmalonyl-CoA decarboxylase n=1 Tax=Cylicocyclus nassatus TaxID=53992 RepID=A0AA36GFS8_CYLNA|nr:unnamed protein product [Cylicocyclus nassatus]
MSRCILRLRPVFFGEISPRAASTYTSNADLANALEKWKGGAVDLAVSGAVARLRLNRPEKSNCLSGEMMVQLRKRSEELASLSEPGVLVVEGVGKSFCSGADLGFVKEVSDPVIGSAYYQFMFGTLRNIRTSPLVSVARLHGHCLGGGSEIATSCDLRFAHKDAKIGFLQARMGIVPTWEGAHYLPSIVGRSSALRLQTTASIITAQEAKDLGYVDVIYEKDEEFEELISSMLKNGAEVCKAQKAMIDATGKGEEAKLAVIRSVWGGKAQKQAIQRQLDAVVNKKSKK